MSTSFLNPIDLFRSPSPPSAPDFAGAATAQGRANKEAAIASAQLSNPNITNAQGSQTVTYTIDPKTGNPIPNINQQLAPGQQQIFNQNEQLQQRLGLLGLGAADIAGKTLNEPLNFNERLGTQTQGRQEVIDALMSRFNQDFGDRQENLNADLIARGHAAGDKGFEAAQDRLGRTRTDALQQATIAADQKALDERRQAITELLAERQVPLNEISAFRTGSQIQPLQFQPYQGQNVAPPPVFGATQLAGQYGTDVYNADVAARNAQMQGLFGLGAAGILAASDRRLKSNINRIGTHPIGVGIYEYDIFGRHEIGVMAQEVLQVKPESVVRHPDGYLMVNYADL
jgi:hypothetical protein